MLRINYKTLLYFSTARRACRAAAIGFSDTTVCRPPVFCQYKTRVKREFAPRTAPLVLLASASHRFLCSLQTAHCGGGTALLKSSIRFVKARHQLKPSAAFLCRVGRLLLVFQTQRYAALSCFAIQNTRQTRVRAANRPACFAGVCLTQIFMRSANSTLRRGHISPQKFYSFCESAASIRTICGVSVPR